MKTFEEALGKVVQNSSRPQPTGAVIAEFKETVEKNQCIVDEAINSETLRAYLCYQIAQQATEHDDDDPQIVFSLAFGCFIAGLIVGMEMEKQQ